MYIVVWDEFVEHLDRIEPYFELYTKYSEALEEYERLQNRKWVHHVHIAVELMPDN